MNCKLPHKYAIDNSRSFLIDMEVIDENLNILNEEDFDRIIDDLEKKNIKYYEVSGKPWLKSLDRSTAVPNIDLLNKVDNKRKELGLFEDQMSISSTNTKVEEVSRTQEVPNQFINNKVFNLQSKVRRSIDDIINNKKIQIDKETSDTIYSLLTKDYREELLKLGITPNNFNQKINEQILKVNPDTWFERIINYIKRILLRDRLFDLVKSIKDQKVTPLFTEEGKMLIYGITSNQGRNKIPIINSLLYRSITPANYKVGRILRKAGVSLFVGKTYEDFIDTITKWRNQDIMTNEVTENKIIPEWATKISRESYNKREDAWRLSNGLPQKHNTFKYLGRGFLDSEYNLVLDENGEDVYGFVNPQFDEKDIKRNLGIDKTNAVMGKYAIKIGIDDKGHYFQYNDRWDLDILNPIISKIVDATQTPFIVSGKIYKALDYDPVTQEPFVYYTHNDSDINIEAYNKEINLLNEQELFDKDFSFTGLEVKDYVDNEILGAKQESQPDEVYGPEVHYQLRIINALQSDKVRQPKSDNLQGFYNDIKNQGVSNQQIGFIRDVLSSLEGNVTKEDIIRELLVKYSYTVEIETAKTKRQSYGSVQVGWNEFENQEVIEEVNTNYYSNLTVPGGTNYTENEIRTPNITPSITGHAQFATKEGIGWFRASDRVTYTNKEELINLLKNSKLLEIDCS